MYTLKPGRLATAAKQSNLPICIVGVGGTGSRLAEALVRIGFGTQTSPIMLIDGDHFVNHNLRNQLMESEDVNFNKVITVASKLRFICEDVQLVECPWKIEVHKPNSIPDFRGIVFLAVDNMDVRADIVEHCLENRADVSCVIDPRLDSGVGVSYCFDPNLYVHQECWWTYWHPDQEAENIAGCGGTQPVIASVFGTTALALKQLEHFYAAGTTHGIPNRVYYDFDQFTGSCEVWPT